MAKLNLEEVRELERRAELSSPLLSPSPLIERLDLIEAQVNGIPLIREAIATLIRETRLLRDTVNDTVAIRARQQTQPRHPKRLIVQAIIASAGTGAAIGALLTILLHH